MKALALGLMLTSFSSALAGQGTITGKEYEGWQNGYYNVAIGTMKKLEAERGSEYGRYRATFAPVAKMGGTFDPSLNPSLPVVFYVGATVGAADQLPPEDALVMVVIQFMPADATRDKPSGFIFSDICSFMPGEKALVVLKGMDDPRVQQTLKRLQNARAHPNPNPNATPEASPKNDK